MSDAPYTCREIRLVLEEDHTDCYVYLEDNERGDCPAGVQGWHHKRFSANAPRLAVVMQAHSATDWPQGTPP